VWALLTAGDVPWTDDARFYVEAAKTYANWLEGFITFDASAWSRGGIDAAFSVNSEHPPVAKYIMGISWLVLGKWTGLLGDVEACRVGVKLLWAATAVVIFSLLRGRVSIAAQIFSLGAYGTLPRLLFHGHVESLDFPVTALLTLSMALLFHTLEKQTRRGIGLTLLTFGLALGTKLNAPFALGAAFLYWLIKERPHYRGTTLRLPTLPWVLLGMTLVSPLVMWLGWPWLWFDTLARLNSYLHFHMQHYGILFYFQGALYGDQVAPWYAPLTMLALTTPLPILLLMLAGVLKPLATSVGSLPFAYKPDSSIEDELRNSPSHRLALFCFLQAAMQILAVSLPGVPKYGGVKLFLPALPFLVVLAGLSFEALIGERANSTRRQHLVIAAVLLLPGLVGVLSYGGHLLSYYNALAGGAGGATAKGYERQYYDLAYGSIPEVLNDVLPHGGSVAIEPNPKEYAPHLARWKSRGILRANIGMGPSSTADVMLLTHERRWPKYLKLRLDLRVRKSLWEETVDGIPLYTVYDLRSP
jgi:4-amino-4-deoxy-L-arabinose transferase-like glycosyltransferase